MTMNIHSVIAPDLSNREDLKHFLAGMKDEVMKIMKIKRPEQQNKETQNLWLEEFSKILKRIVTLKKTPLSPKDMSFLTLMERYYYVVSSKLELKPEDYKKYLRMVREDFGIFYITSALNNTYDITKNPLGLDIPDLLSTCSFIGNKFKDEDGKIDRTLYSENYYSGDTLKLITLLEEAKKNVPDFKKENINILLLRKIFHFNNTLSKDVFEDIIFRYLWFTHEEIAAMQKKYE